MTDEAEEIRALKKLLRRRNADLYTARKQRKKYKEKACILEERLTKQDSFARAQQHAISVLARKPKHRKSLVDKGIEAVGKVAPKRRNQEAQIPPIGIASRVMRVRLGHSA